MRYLLAPLLAVLALTACSDPWEGIGTVTEKQYDDPDSWWQPGYTIDGGQSCSTYNNVRTCHDNPDTHIPGSMQYDPEHFLLRVADNSSEETKYHTVRVAPTVWDACEVGQTFSTITQRCT